MCYACGTAQAKACLFLDVSMFFRLSRSRPALQCCRLALHILCLNNKQAMALPQPCSSMDLWPKYPLFNTGITLICDFNADMLFTCFAVLQAGYSRPALQQCASNCRPLAALCALPARGLLGPGPPAPPHDCTPNVCTIPSQQA